MKTLRNIITLFFSTTLVMSSYADPPNTFTPGATILSSEMNESFSDLDQRLASLESNAQIITEVAIDCDLDADTLKNRETKDAKSYILTGMCNGPIEIFGSKDVKFIGDGNRDDGVQLPGGLTKHPYAAIGVYGPSKISFHKKIKSMLINVNSNMGDK